MQERKEKKVEKQRKFLVGIVGASESEVESIGRIFAVTKFRTRCYQAKAIEISEFKRQHNIDLILMCSNNPRIMSTWNQSNFSKSRANQPMIYLARQEDHRFGKYQLNSPVNPSRFIKLLDHYTISELNYFPEFEIGSDERKIDTSTLSGLKILHKSAVDHGKGSEFNTSLLKNALVVDDSLAVRRQMQIEFQLRSDSLDLSEDAESALIAIEKKKYDIIFLDVVMPGMDGYAACKRIKKSRLNMDTPVILLTSRSSSFDKIKGALAGCDAYLIKPIDHNEFVSIYDKFTESKIHRGQAHAS